MKTVIGITLTVIIVVIVSIFTWRRMNPGVYIPYKCNEGGDDSRKFYDPNWQARGAVCDGLYIPFGTKLNNINKEVVLAKMGEISDINPSAKDNMQSLADMAISSISTSGKG